MSIENEKRAMFDADPWVVRLFIYAYGVLVFLHVLPREEVIGEPKTTGRANGCQSHVNHIG